MAKSAFQLTCRLALGDQCSADGAILINMSGPAYLEEQADGMLKEPRGEKANA
jgi:hypothetical protein